MQDSKSTEKEEQKQVGRKKLWPKENYARKHTTANLKQKDMHIIIFVS